MDTQNKKLIKTISITEMYNTLQTMGNNKAPGNDGLTSSVYKMFWKTLKKPLYDSLTNGLEDKQLSRSQTQSIIRLIEKRQGQTIYKELEAS